MKRVGYDADSGRYYFRDHEGSLYKGPEGSEFGELTLGELWAQLCYHLVIAHIDIQCLTSLLPSLKR